MNIDWILLVWICFWDWYLHECQMTRISGKKLGNTRGGVRTSVACYNNDGVHEEPGFYVWRDQPIATWIIKECCSEKLVKQMSKQQNHIICLHVSIDVISCYVSSLISWSKMCHILIVITVIFDKWQIKWVTWIKWSKNNSTFIWIVWIQ